MIRSNLNETRAKTIFLTIITLSSTHSNTCKHTYIHRFTTSEDQKAEEAVVEIICKYEFQSRLDKTLENWWKQNCLHETWNCTFSCHHKSFSSIFQSHLMHSINTDAFVQSKYDAFVQSKMNDSVNDLLRSILTAIRMLFIEGKNL